MSRFFFLLLLAGALLFSGGCKKPAPDLRGRLELKSTPAGALLAINGKDFGKAPGSFQVPPGSYLVKFSLPGHRPEWRVVSVETGRTGTASVELKKETATLLISSEPSGVKIFTGDDLRGTTPLVLTGLSFGKYVFRTEKPGTTPRVVEEELRDMRPQEMLISLNSNVGQLALTTEPEAGKLYLNDVLQGDTPFQGSLEEGTYRLRLEKSGFRTREDTITIVRDRRLAYAHKFQLQPGSLKVDSAPAGALIRLNGKGYGSTPLEIEELDTGHYMVNVSHPGFIAQEKEVEIVPGNRANLSFDLEKSSGGIELVVNPPGATVFLNGKKIGESPRGETEFIGKVMEIPNLEPGEYEIVAMHRRAVPERVRLRVKVEKGRITRPAPLELWVANAEIKLRSDGRVYIGVLRAEGDDTITFSPEPSITEYHNKSNLAYIKRLENKE